MIFNSYIFLFAFLPVTFAGFWILKKKNARYIWLSLASYIFYGFWNYKFVFLMLFTSTVDFIAGQLIYDSKTQRSKKLALLLALTVNLGLLAFFKYFNFTALSLENLFDLFKLNINFPIINVILPVGISFYTFQSMSYAIDIYRGKVKPTKNFFEYTTYISLFPQLVAGPIVRFKDIVSDLDSIHLLRRSSAFHSGVSIFVVGLVKKVIVADSIALFADSLWADVSNLNSVYAWAAVLGYTYQLYFDFSGYSDMAIGLGRLFGFNFPQNFNSPYKAKNISDFWQRWHISLSTWLRDYLYIPLGGSKLGNARTYFNLLITMLLGGLWHGASWTFVVWGGYHGALLSLYKMFGKKYDLLPVFFQRISTFFAIVIGWVFFRSPTFATAWTMLKKMFGVGELMPGAAAFDSMTTLFFLLASCLLITNFLPNSYEWPYSKKPRFALLLAAVLVLALIFMNYKQSVFLYYQF